MDERLDQFVKKLTLMNFCTREVVYTEIFYFPQVFTSQSLDHGVILWLPNVYYNAFIYPSLSITTTRVKLLDFWTLGMGISLEHNT